MFKVILYTHVTNKLSRRGGGGGYGGGGRGRRIIEYHDLDAPADMEF